MGYIHRKFGKGPQELAKMNPKQATNFILDVVSSLEDENLAGSYIMNYVKVLKNWFEYNDVQITRKIKVAGSEEAAKYADEKPPTPEELRRILDMAELSSKVACSIVAFSGVRLEVLGNHLGSDGLKVKDFPELAVHGKSVEFKKVPTTIVVRKEFQEQKTLHKFPVR